MIKKIVFAVIFCFLICEHAFSDEKSVDLGDIVITPTGYSAFSMDYPGNVTVINSEDIERSNAKYVYELLRQEPGLYVTDYTGAGKTVSVDMRGFGETANRNVLVMIDGRRVNEIDISGTDWSQIPLQNVERIEILRGSGAVLYGDNAAAGVINIITKRGETGHHLKGGADFGNYRYQNYYGSISGRDEFASYNFFFKREDTDGYRLNGDFDAYDFMGAMTIYPAEYLDIDISGGYHKDWYGLPAGLQRWEIDQIGYRGSTTPNDRSKTETTYLKVTPALHFTAGDMGHDLVCDFWGRKKRLNTTTWANWFPFIPWFPSWDSSQIDSIGGSVKYTNELNKENVSNNLTLGIDMFQAENRILTVTPMFMTYNQLKITKRTLGLFITDQMEFFDKFILNAGFRQEWADFVFDQAVNTGQYQTKSPEERAFDVGGEFKYLERGAIYGRYSRSFRFPATEEFYSRWMGLNPGLKHQVDDTWEVGIKDRNWPFFQPQVDFFWMISDNEIYYDPTVGMFGDNRNYGRIKRFGIETGAASNILEIAQVYLNYTYIDAEFDGGRFSGNKVPMVPEHKIAWGVSIFPVEYIEVNFNSEYVSPQYSINDQYNRLPKLKSRFVCNGKITAKYKGIKVFFGINNIFDTRYSEIAVSNMTGTVTDLHPAAERNYVFGASVEI